MRVFKLCGSQLRNISCLKRPSLRWFTSEGLDNNTFYDVIIVGGGMVGSTLACALGKKKSFQDKKVLVLEAGPQVKLTKVPELYSNRVSTITAGNKKLLEDVGVWKHIEKMRVKPFRKMQVWDACGEGYITFDASSDFEHPVNMAYVVENNVLVTAVEMELEKMRPNIDIMYKMKLKEFVIPKQHETENTPWVKVILENGEMLSTRLLVGADGANSFIRKSLEIDCISHDYHQSGVVATLCFSEPTDNIVAWQRFLPTGPVALLPLSNTKSSLAWTTTTNHAKTLVSLPEEKFVDAVNDALSDAIGRNSISQMASHFMHNALSIIKPDYLGLQIPPTISSIEENSRADFPLGVTHASYYVKPRLALIGDAAHRIHPLAGQGVNLGFGDVECLAHLLCQASLNGQDLGSMEHLLKYETRRQKDVVAMMVSTHGLNTLFSNSFLPFVVMRNLGFQLTNALSPVKKQIVGYAMK